MQQLVKAVFPWLLADEVVEGDHVRKLERFDRCNLQPLRDKPKPVQACVTPVDNSSLELEEVAVAGEPNLFGEFFVAEASTKAFVLDDLRDPPHRCSAFALAFSRRVQGIFGLAGAGTATRVLCGIHRAVSDRRARLSLCFC